MKIIKCIFGNTGPSFEPRVTRFIFCRAGHFRQFRKGQFPGQSILEMRENCVLS